MTKREIELLLVNRFQQLKLITETIEEFEKIEGKTGVDNRINAILDEINFYKNVLKKINDNEN